MSSPLTPLVGRDRQVVALRSLLGTQRLVTVVGAAGCGKTRLAVEVAGAIEGAVFVDLAPLADPALVPAAMARALGLREAGALPLDVTLRRHLSEHTEFMVVDNVEHVLDAAPDLADLLAGCPGLRVLATSRSPLRVPGEQVVPLRPLPLPGQDDVAVRERLLEVPSVALLITRLLAVQPDVELSDEALGLVAGICRALDGLPLALELAAAQVRDHGLAEVLVRARTGPDELPRPPRRAVAARHRSLHAAIGWSVERLDGPQRRLLGRLSVFAGGWTAAAAQEVCGEPGRDVRCDLTALAEQSLVEVAPSGVGVRHRMLDTVRRYAAELTTDPEDDRLLGWCRSLAAAVAAVPVPDESRWFDTAEAELDNVRAALDSCAPAGTPVALHTAADLYFFWDVRGHLGEGVRHLRRLLDRPEAHRDATARLRALQALGLLLVWQDETEAADGALREAALLADRTDDRAAWAWCAGSLAIAHFVGGDVGPVAPLAERGLAVAREAGEWLPLLRATCGLGLVRWSQGRHEEARALLEENAHLAQPSSWGVGKANWFLGWFAFLDGDLDEAGRLFGSGAAVFRRVGDRRSLPDCLDGVACVAAARGASTEALELLGEAEALRARSGSRRSAYLVAHCDVARDRARATCPGTAPAGITAREHEVAALVAAGLTNRGIGRRLGISERTAERHVENLRGKLGVGTRAQVAAWVAALPTAAAADVAGTTHVGRTATPVD